MADENRHRSRSWLQRFLRDKHGGATGEGEEPTSTAARALVNRDNKVILDVGDAETLEEALQATLMKTNVINGLAGGTLITDTTLHEGNWIGFTVEAEGTKVETLTGNIAGVADATEGSAPELSDGHAFHGQITAIKLHSGRVFVFNPPAE